MFNDFNDAVYCTADENEEELVQDDPLVDPEQAEPEEEDEEDDEGNSDDEEGDEPEFVEEDK